MSRSDFVLSTALVGRSSMNKLLFLNVFWLHAYFKSPNKYRIRFSEAKQMCWSMVKRIRHCYLGFSWSYILDTFLRPRMFIEFSIMPRFFMKEKHITFQKTGITFQNDRRRTFHALCTRQRAKIENSKNMEGIRNVSRYRIKQKIEITFDKRSAPLNVAVQLSFRYEILHVAEMPKDL